ncbi:hypothetical protein [Micromonospora profundi]|uniref:hypothetical protein n=1 Tax=Micromonospora TaxID=1873 RepID=UPI0033A6D631
MLRTANSHYRLAIFVLLAAGLVVILGAGPDAMVSLADGFGWGASPQDTPTAPLVGDGFGWGAPAPVDPRRL